MKTILALLCILAAPAGAVEFRQPVNGDVVVTAYFDLGNRQDWNCGDNTYGGHRGTDIAIVGRFAAQDDGRDVVAAAPGRVTRTLDGEFDRCTTADCPGGGGFGNHVVIEHDDGKVSYYAHLRRGSVAVQQGDQVQCGQRIGQVGSSGHSTGPHLHFEVRVGGGSDDPFSGPCGGPQSWWVDQGPYNGLPTRECEVGEPPPPADRPDFHLAADWQMPERACDFDECADFVRDGGSRGVKDAWVGEDVALSVVVRNEGNAPTQGESPEDAAVELQYRLPDGLAPTRYRIESDHPSYDRTTWALNDAMQNAANPPADAPPSSGVLRLNGFSPREAKRVTIWARATARNIDVPRGQANHSARIWIRHLRGFYGEKTDWDDPVEINQGQRFNGGDLRVAAPIDVFSQTAFLFDAPEDEQIEGWRRCAPDAVGRLTLNRAETAMALEVTGDGPCVESPPLAVDLNAETGARLRIRQHQGARMGWLQWTTIDAPAFDADRQVAFETSGGGEFDDVRLDPAWSGTLTRLRLLPVAGAGEGSPWVDLDAMEVVADGAAPGPEPDAPGPDSPEPESPEPETPEPESPEPDAPEPSPRPEPQPLPPPPESDAGPDDRQDTEGSDLNGGCAAAPGGDETSGWWLALLLIRRRRSKRPRHRETPIQT